MEMALEILLSSLNLITNKTMKRLLTLLAIFIAGSTYATDRIVEEWGVSPTYSSIQAAIDAASNGDRILIKNRTGGIPWIEDITIAKTLELLSYDNDVQWIIQGNVLVTAANGRNITILGMRNMSGDLNHTSGSADDRSTHVRVIDCSFEDGGLDLAEDEFIMDVIHTDVTDGQVYNYSGNIIGCDLTNTRITCYNSNPHYGETCKIIGNKITFSTASSSYGTEGINLNSTAYDFEVKNNFITATRGISVERSASDQTFWIWNNTIRTTASTSTASTSYGAKGLEIRHNSGIGSSSGTYEIMNNVIDVYATANATNYGIDIYQQNGDINCYYNIIDSDYSPEISGNVTLDFNNTTTTSFNIPGSGIPPGGSPAIDGANPGAPFFDLDLSTGDAGAYGGSYTLNNFHPLHTGSARIWYVEYPFNVRQGSTLNINADSYDR